MYTKHGQPSQDTTIASVHFNVILGFTAISTILSRRLTRTGFGKRRATHTGLNTLSQQCSARNLLKAFS